MMDIFSQIWVWIASIFGGLTLSTVFVAIIVGCLKGAFHKTIAKIDIRKIADEATDKGVERVKEIAFTHSIEPIVESELQKINEKSSALIKEELRIVQNKYDKLVDVIEKLSAYFDNSIGVPENAKKELREAIENAKDKAPVVESKVACEVVTEKKKPVVTTRNTNIPKQTTVER